MVDDSAASRAKVKTALEAAGFNVVEASEGVEALWRARQQTFDFILTDIHMPTMDGITLIRELRKLPEYSGIPIVALTSDCSKARVAEIKGAGGTAWVSKPPDIDSVVALVRARIIVATGMVAGT